MDFQYSISSNGGQQQYEFIKLGLRKKAYQIQRELHQAIGPRAYSMWAVQ